MFRGKSIVVLDDSKQVRKILTSVLKKHGYLVTAFASAEETIEFTENNLPDLLIIDFYKTGIDIGSFQQELGGIPHVSSLPIFCISGNKQDDNRLLSYLPNITHIFHKPVKIKDLITKINSYFEHSSKQSVPIFNGDLGSVDVWKLLKHIEESGVTGYIEVITKDSKKIKFTLIKGMLDDLVMMGADGDDPISYLLNENEGVLTVYQELVSLKPLEEEEFAEDEKEQVLFAEEPGSADSHYMVLLGNLIKKLIEEVGRQDTLKTFMKVSLKLSKTYPELRLLNVNYQGEVTWEGDIEISKVVNFVDAFARLILDILVEMGAVSGDMYELHDFIPADDPNLNKLDFYKVYEKQLD